jgi:hypothetical protein
VTARRAAPQRAFDSWKDIFFSIFIPLVFIGEDALKMAGSLTPQSLLPDRPKIDAELLG